jgi:hypothetical protein
MSRKCASISQPYGSSRPVTGTALLFCFIGGTQPWIISNVWHRYFLGRNEQNQPQIVKNSHTRLCNFCRVFIIYFRKLLLVKFNYDSPPFWKKWKLLKNAHTIISKFSSFRLYPSPISGYEHLVAHNADDLQKAVWGFLVATVGNDTANFTN